ncbi:MULTISPECIES: sigma-54 interaction domain-containing protein [unclassified Clostridium]|uniref:sigma-54 interaction domain-containing protein n=1 Tax=unclassified Clostridium TaxID=2614128 RepID=UPI00291228EE|nr:sigma 54-interacting transcriptional regulator [Clostridium sp.]MDU5106377.1 sigma 54-interacting transcriptional regulator [Clostridium sp.]
MSSILKEIQSAVMRYINIVEKILSVDVEVVDENLIRIAATGAYKNRIDKDISKQGYAYREVLKSGEFKAITEPGKDSICRNCIKRGKCEELFEMSTPIKLQGKIIGVLGLVCFNEEQKEQILEKFDNYKAFMEQIAEFISTAAYENLQRKREDVVLKSLNLIIDKMDQGVMVLNKNDKVTHINSKGVELIKHVDNFFASKVTIESTGDSLFQMEIYKVSIGNQSYQFIGNIFPMGLNDNQFDKIFVFRDYKGFRDNISEYTNIKNTIKTENILGQTLIMQDLKRKVKRIALSTSTVLVTGESGTGKEVFARAIHNEGNRKSKAFVAINCGAIPDTLLESELFGYVKGAFTGADPMGKIGKFELANKGTIFLDEIGDMPIYLQTKLLRVLQERKITRVGSNKEIDIDVRVIAATNKNLSELIRENKFREDLYYRLNVIPFVIPPLRDRIEDIELLIEFFIDKYTNLLDKSFENIVITEDVKKAFYRYSWPGNVRELENTIEFIVNMIGTDGIIDKEVIPKNILSRDRIDSALDRKEIIPLKELEEIEIKKALELYGTTTEDKKLIAKKLGIGIATLYRKIDEYKLLK